VTLTVAELSTGLLVFFLFHALLHLNCCHNFFSIKIPSIYYHSHFFAATLDFTIFFIYRVQMTLTDVYNDYWMWSNCYEEKLNRTLDVSNVVKLLYFNLMDRSSWWLKCNQTVYTDSLQCGWTYTEVFQPNFEPWMQLQIIQPNFETIECLHINPSPTWFVAEWCTGCIHLAINWISAYSCQQKLYCPWTNSKPWYLLDMWKNFCPCAYRWSKSSEECCTELFWPSLSIRRKYLSLTMIYSILHNEVSLQFSDYFTFSSAPTRSYSLSLLCKQPSINSYQYSFFMNRCNSIPFDILSFTTVLLLGVHCIILYVLISLVCINVSLCYTCFCDTVLVLLL